MDSSLTWTQPGPWPMATIDVPLDGADERALVEACLAGRREAFDLIVERHRRTVLSALLPFRREPRRRERPDAGCLRARLPRVAQLSRPVVARDLAMRIGVNVCLNRVSARALPTEPIADRQFIDQAGDTGSDRLLREERQARVRAAIAQLPRKQRATLILRMYASCRIRKSRTRSAARSAPSRRTSFTRWET